MFLQWMCLKLKYYLPTKQKLTKTLTTGSLKYILHFRDKGSQGIVMYGSIMLGTGSQKQYQIGVHCSNIMLHGLMPGMDSPMKYMGMIVRKNDF